MSDPYGLSRVMGEKGVLPQQAQKLDPSLPIREDELLIEVDSLNVDAASFRQLKEAAGGDVQKMVAAIAEIIRSRGKMHNPVTGSGGMLMGRVKEVGPKHPARGVLVPGERIATLVSLTLTPLFLREVKAIHPAIDRLDVEGHAILFASGLYAKLPGDLPETLALAALDVCGAPALLARHLKPGMKVAVLGAGKSGALCLAQARKIAGTTGKLLAVDISSKALRALFEIGLCDEALQADATDAVGCMDAVRKATSDALCDVVVNCASVPGTEMASLLSVRDGGTVIFFSMATSFSAAALGAEGVGKDALLVLGNGYVPGHAELTLELLRSHPRLRELFEKRYA